MSILSDLASILLVFATLVLAYATIQLKDETTKMRKLQTNPMISIYIRPYHHVNAIYLVIKNIGFGPAHSVKFTPTNPDFVLDETSAPLKISELNLIKKGLPYFPPQREYIYFMTSLVINTKEKYSNPFKIHVSYKTASNELIEEDYPIDFSLLDKSILINQTDNS